MSNNNSSIPVEPCNTNGHPSAMEVDVSPVADEELGNIILNVRDGLPPMRTLRDGGMEVDIDSDLNLIDGIDLGKADSREDLIYDKDLPSSLILTGFDLSFFENVQLREVFEEMFQAYEKDVTFNYFRSFKRVRVNFKMSSSAAKARIKYHETKLGHMTINCYFAQPVVIKDDHDHHLQPPVPDKQFLISPPASPPYDWQPASEARPAVNYDLIAAIANMGDGSGQLEIHQASDSQPGIIVSGCDGPANIPPQKPNIIQTRRPD